MNSKVLSLAGTPAASPLGYFRWTFGQGARDPYYIMVIIYVFYPYFSNTVVDDPVKGQALIGYITAAAGFVLASTAPFLGAIADKDGRRKPWVVGTVLVMTIGAFSLWFIEPKGQGLSLGLSLAILFVIKICFTLKHGSSVLSLPS